MKKLTALVLSAILLLSLTACVQKNKTNLSQQQLQRLSVLTDINDKYYQSLKNVSSEELKYIISETNNLYEDFAPGYIGSDFEKVVNETNGNNKKIDYYIVAQSRIYFIRLNAMLLTDDPNYEEEFKNQYIMFSRNVLTQYHDYLNDSVVSLADTQKDRVINAYYSVYNESNDDVEKYNILTDLGFAFECLLIDKNDSRYIKNTDLIKQVTDRHSVTDANGEKQTDVSFLERVNDYKYIRYTDGTLLRPSDLTK